MDLIEALEDGESTSEELLAVSKLIQEQEHPAKLDEEINSIKFKTRTEGAAFKEYLLSSLKEIEGYISSKGYNAFEKVALSENTVYMKLKIWQSSSRKTFSLLTEVPESDHYRVNIKNFYETHGKSCSINANRPHSTS